MNEWWQEMFVKNRKDRIEKEESFDKQTKSRRIRAWKYDCMCMSIQMSFSPFILDFSEKSGPPTQSTIILHFIFNISIETTRKANLVFWF